MGEGMGERIGVRKTEKFSRVYCPTVLDRRPKEGRTRADYGDVGGNFALFVSKGKSCHKPQPFR